MIFRAKIYLDKAAMCPKLTFSHSNLMGSIMVRQNGELTIPLQMTSEEEQLVIESYIRDEVQLEYANRANAVTACSCRCVSHCSCDCDRCGIAGFRA